MTASLLDKIKSQGYWHIVIRPATFTQERIPTLRQCRKLIEDNQVKYRGWYFPHFDERDIKRGPDYIELGVSFRSINETWRFFQSGQLAFFSGLAEDWVSEDPVLSEGFRNDLKPSTVLDILSVLHQLSELYEFAARLAQRDVYGDALVVNVTLANIKGRQLFYWPGQGRILSRRFSCLVPELAREARLSSVDLVAQSREYSYQHFLWLMERFEFEPSEAMFRRDQEKFFEGRY